MDQKSKPYRYGVVSVETFRNSYRLRWRYQGKVFSLTVPGRLTPEAYTKAWQLAQVINSDIVLGIFDVTKEKYQPCLTPVVETLKPNLKVIWEQYKLAKKDIVAKTSQANKWRSVDRLLDSVNQSLDFKNAPNWVENWSKRYSYGMLSILTQTLKTALNWAIKQGLISKMPNHTFDSLKIVKDNSPKLVYSDQEIYRIIQAFESNEFADHHDYYANLVKFLAFTGCRPEDALALEWVDYKVMNGRPVIVFLKAYSKGVLKSTKNNTVRLFPVNSQLQEVLESQRVKVGNNKLIFPGVKGGYISWENFNKRQWKPVVTQLFNLGEISQVLPPYHLRHSFCTRLNRAGIDWVTIGYLVENSPEMLSRHYLSPNTDIVVPEF